MNVLWMCVIWQLLVINVFENHWYKYPYEGGYPLKRSPCKTHILLPNET